MSRTDEIHKASKEYVLRSFSNSKMSAFQAGARYADRTLTDRAIAWLIDESNNDTIDLRHHEEFEKRFRKAMKE